MNTTSQSYVSDARVALFNYLFKRLKTKISNGAPIVLVHPFPEQLFMLGLRKWKGGEVKVKKGGEWVHFLVSKELNEQETLRLLQVLLGEDSLPEKSEKGVKVRFQRVEKVSYNNTKRLIKLTARVTLSL